VTMLEMRQASARAYSSSRVVSFLTSQSASCIFSPSSSPLTISTHDVFLYPNSVVEIDADVGFYDPGEEDVEFVEKLIALAGTASYGGIDTSQLTKEICKQTRVVGAAWSTNAIVPAEVVELMMAQNLFLSDFG